LGPHYPCWWIGRKELEITQQQAIAFIENGEWEFWVEVPNGDSVWVGRGHKPLWQQIYQD